MEKSLYTPDHLKEQEITKQLEFIGGNINFVQSLVRKDEYQKETEKHIVEKYLNFLKLLLKKMDVDVKTKTISFDINGKKISYLYSKDKNGDEIFVSGNTHFGRNQFDKFGVSFEFLEKILNSKSFDYKF